MYVGETDFGGKGRIMVGLRMDDRLQPGGHDGKVVSNETKNLSVNVRSGEGGAKIQMRDRPRLLRDAR